jgi:hypothetical protein
LERFSRFLTGFPVFYLVCLLPDFYYESGPIFGWTGWLGQSGPILITLNDTKVSNFLYGTFDNSLPDNRIAKSTVGLKDTIT